MPRILLIAEAANPQWVSVPLVGWCHARAIMDVADAHLVTQIRNREAILAAGLVEGRDFTAIDSEAVARRAHRVSELLRGKSGVNWTTSTALQTLSYPYFEHLLWKQFGRRIRGGEFDVVHRITPLSPTTPSSIAAKCKDAGVPFVLGPLNGGVPWPKGFDLVRRQEHEWLSYVRDIYRLLPGYHSTRQNASAILIGSRDTWQQMPRSYWHKCFYMAENAIEPTRFVKRRTRRAVLPIRAVFVGRLVPYKGADMLIDAALPLLREGKMTIDIVGDGPQMPELRATVERENLQQSVTLSGWVQHEQVQNRLADADLFVFPSVREFGGGAALEAMAVGLPAVVLNYGGPAELVTDATGFLIEMGTRDQIVARLRNVLTTAAANPDFIERKSALAYRRAHEHFTWSAKARQTLEVYEWLLHRRDRPDFAMPTPDVAGEFPLPLGRVSA